MRSGLLPAMPILIAAGLFAACVDGGRDQAEPEPAAPVTAPEATTHATGTAEPTVTEDPPAVSTTIEASEEEPARATATTTVPETTGVTETVAAPQTTAITEPPVPEGPPVPALTLELDDGTVFMTAESVRPVLYVFWAEW